MTPEDIAEIIIDHDAWCIDNMTVNSQPCFCGRDIEVSTTAERIRSYGDERVHRETAALRAIIAQRDDLEQLSAASNVALRAQRDELLAALTGMMYELDLDSDDEALAGLFDGAAIESIHKAREVIAKAKGESHD